MVLDPHMEILVVEDLPSIRLMICGLLRSLQFRSVREAANGSEALTELRRQRADLVLTDWNMPRMNGIELLQAMRRDESLKDIPLLMVTGTATKDEVVEALRAGANGYIIKPFIAKTLKEKLDTIFHK